MTDEASPEDSSFEARAEPSPPAEPIPLASTGRLLSASFDLLVRSGEDMRRASFYIGAIVLGTAGPLALASWAIAVLGLERTFEEMDATFEGVGGSMFAALVVVATMGLIVATVESKTLGVAVLGGTMAGRPISTRRALARSRHSFWRATVALILVAIPVGVVQAGVSALIDPLFGAAAEASLVTSTLVTALIGAPFAYVLAGVVLGDVDPWEALKRSLRVYGARKAAAVIVVVFETAAALLILFGLSAGLDLALRVFDALGLGPDAGPVGLALTTIGIVAVVFAFGTLLFTVMAVTVAPQVVMFLGLTHATFGLAKVEDGGPHDPDALPQRASDRFRWFTRPMLLAFIVGGLALVGLVAAYR